MERDERGDRCRIRDFITYHEHRPLSRQRLRSGSIIGEIKGRE
jgi:hypothetical protein